MSGLGGPEILLAGLTVVWWVLPTAVLWRLAVAAGRSRAYAAFGLLGWLALALVALGLAWGVSGVAGAGDRSGPT